MLKTAVEAETVNHHLKKTDWQKQRKDSHSLNKSYLFLTKSVSTEAMSSDLFNSYGYCVF